MRRLLVLTAAVLLAACTIGGEDDDNNYTCSAKDQKRFVRDATLQWYLWNDLLPRKKNIKVGNYADPSELLADLTSVQPLDGFSFIGSAAADAAFFGAGQYQGFGFSGQFVDTDDFRLSQVFANSPAGAANFSRGQRIVALDGRTVAEIEAAEGIFEAFNATTLSFTMRETDGVTEFTVDVTQGIVTIDPVPQRRVIDAGGGRMVGYVELSTFVSTADAQLEEAFAFFNANGVNDVIIDLRYNGGGLVSTANLLGDYLGGDVAENLIFSRTLFNADRAAANNSEEFFERLGNSVSLSRLVVIATQGTASASELVTNGMDPHVEVAIVGDRTFGKPVGQVGFEFCGNILRLTAFQNVNADGFGDYFGGLPADCAATDDLNVAVGDAADPNMVAALTYLDTGACPVAAMSGGLAQPALAPGYPQPDRRGPPWREFAGAY